MDIRLLAALFFASSIAKAQSPSPVSRADSGLIGRILLAEDRRDSSDQSIAEGLRHEDGRVHVIAQRAIGRIRDPQFAARESLPPLSPPPVWPEPAWRLRFREILPQRDDCEALRAAAADSVWPVRLRAAMLARESCADDQDLVGTFRSWVDALPANTSGRRAGEVSWHAAAHGLLALARLQPAGARTPARRLAAHDQWQVRMYAARAAGILADTALLRRLANDRDANVREAAIQSLARVAGSAADDVYIAALSADAVQPVRAAANALEGTTRTDARIAAIAAFQRWAARDSETERDVRVALLQAAGRPASDDSTPPARVELPPHAVALALGADARLRVTMAVGTGGGGSFVVRLRGDAAPMMAARILELARSGYYDGLTWHRVEHDFVIQGGSPGANEYVGHPRYLRDELGTVPHVRGTVGMSTRGHDTGDAQWFINLRDNLRLNRDYTVFAEVVEGIEVVDGIMEGDMIRSITVVRAP